ncbi:MAG TPA: tyrosine-protein phosphatase [Alphaproteobacteria bacterium]|nr:tyrosine-protein phosphatase [Alphaproteobacteria bacterium]
MLKQYTRKIGDIVRRARGEMKTPGQRFAAWIEMVFMDHGIFRMIYSNTHRISPKMYRAAQPSPGQVARMAKLGVKTIVNLRGARDGGEYLLQKEACARHGITLIDFPLSSRDAPRKTDARKLKELFDKIEYPAMLHCKSGADRAGLGAALYMHLHEGRPVAEAAQQLHWKYGHFRQAKTGILDFFFDHYGRSTATVQRDIILWSENDYDPEALKRDFRVNRWFNLLVDKILRRE